EPPTAVPPLPRGSGNGSDRLRVSPLARRVAADKGVDLAQVAGSGPGGRIIQRDVLSAAERPAPAAQGKKPSAAGPMPARVARGQREVVPLTKMRQAIAKGLQASKQNVPHFYETIDVDVEDLGKLRARLNESLEKENVRLSLGDLVAKGVAVASAPPGPQRPLQR